ncbi:hypothetical protein F2Q68_00026719 [Brassica cretica]|uniref:Uncharacterized protein n=1 Tax=Brassica cretica TaxID=69181 RepID=A0A8S9I9B4_BRACR|nr:hypothetical protein F2Q68_00026719 [Brassica cretica]
MSPLPANLSFLTSDLESMSSLAEIDNEEVEIKMMVAAAEVMVMVRAEQTLGHYVATELGFELGCYVVTERNGRSVATHRSPNQVIANTKQSCRLIYFTILARNGKTNLLRIRRDENQGQVSFELAFQCRRFEVNQHTVAGVMPGLLKCGQSASREEAVEEMKDCRSTKHPCHRSTVIPEYGLSIFYDRLKPRSHTKLGEKGGTPSKFSWNSFDQPVRFRVQIGYEGLAPNIELLVESLDLEHVIHKSKRAVDTLQAAIGSVEIQESIDTIYHASIDTVHPTSIDTIQPVSENIVQHEGNKQHGSEELSKSKEAETSYPASSSIDTCTSTSTDGRTSTSTDGRTSTSADGRTSTSTDGRTSASTDGTTSTSTDGRTSTSTDGRTSTSADGRTSTSTDGRTSASTDGTTSTSTDGTTSTSTDSTTSTSIIGTNSTSTDDKTSTSTDEKTSTSIDSSTQKSTDVSSCDIVPDVDREITMEDFLELDDEAQPENLDHNLEKKLDDHQHTSKKDLEISPEASIDRQHPPDIDRYPPDCIDRHPPDDIDRHPGLDELS